MAPTLSGARRRQYDDWIAAYLEAVVPKSEAPERFHFWTAAAIIAGALRRRVHIDMEAFRWYPNLYIVLVGPPGTVKKSTTINIGARLLRDVPNVHFGSDITTWEGFLQELEEAEDDFCEGDPVGYLDFDQPYKITRALTCAISEWGTFLDPNNHQMINVLTEVYDGKSDIPLRKNTKTQGSNTISNPFVNIIAGTTPDWMNDNFRGRFGGWGFSSRCIFLHCLEPERLVPYPDEFWQGTFRTSMHQFLADLCEISTLQGPFAIDPDARDFGRAWYRDHMERKILLDRHPDHDPWLSYYLARKFDHAHKLSMVLAVSRGNQLRISLDILQAACARCDEVENELAQVFGPRNRSTSRAAAMNDSLWRELENLITKNNGGMPERAVFQWSLRRLTLGETKAFIDQLLAAGWLTREVDGSETWITFGSAYAPSAHKNGKPDGAAT